MGISLAFGVIAATAITLVLVPAAYLVLEDIEHALFASPEETEQTESPESESSVSDRLRAEAAPLA
jgi:hypothetical protein